MSNAEGYLLLFAGLLAILLYRLWQYRRRIQLKYESSQTRYSAINQRSSFSFFVRTLSLITSWVLLTVALTRPPEAVSQGLPLNLQKSEELPKVDEVAFILDVSASMGCKDAQGAESRLERAKEIIGSLVEELGGINVSLLAFAGNSQMVVPDTLDYLYFRILLDAVSINETGEAGTNLLAMCDTVKSNFVDSPYSKFVRIILLTDGEDTGFLDMSGTAKEHAEETLIEHIHQTAGNKIQWEVIGLGTSSGAMVPDVVFEGKPVASHMQRALLERIAKAGLGHLYVDAETSLTQIADNLLADIAGEQMPAALSGSQANFVVSRAGSDVLFMLASALILLFISIVLPESIKKTTGALTLLLFFTIPLQSDNAVGQKIDTAIEFARAGRADLALTTFEKLMQSNLTAIEKACVLYDQSVIYAAQDKFWEALTTLNQIDDEMFQKTNEASPIQAMQIAYNGPIYALGFVKEALQKKDTHMLEAIRQALDRAKWYLTKQDELHMGNMPIRAVIEEKIAESSFLMQELEARWHIDLLDKSETIDLLDELVQRQFFALWGIYFATTTDEAERVKYIQSYVPTHIAKINYCLDRLSRFLQAPAKKSLAHMHDFFITEIERLRAKLVDADLLKIESVLVEISSLLLLIQGEVTDQAVSMLLEDRLQIAMYYLLFSDIDVFRSFWQSKWQQLNDFAQRFLERKSQDSPYVQALMKRLSQERGTIPDVELAAEDITYWKILTQEENTTYLQLAAMLHEGASVGALKAIITPLRDRIQLLGIQAAASLLADTLTYQDLIESWFYVDPESALSFIIGQVTEELNARKASPTLSDYHLLMHLLEIVIEKQDAGMLAKVYRDLVSKESSISSDEKSDLTFFSMLLELVWVKEQLTEDQKTLEAITNRVDFGVDFQRKTLSLVRYSQDPAYVATLELVSSMQEKLTQEASQALTALHSKNEKIAKAGALIRDAEKETKLQTKELSSMQKVQDLLEQASAILHSIKSQAEAPSEGAATHEMQKAPVQLTPELSIRLLQEMEKDDKGLQTQAVPQVTGARPW